MKITFNVDCTPAEAREFFGLPDVSSVNEMIVEEMAKRTKDNLDTLSDPTAFWERAMSAGSGNMDMFSKMFAGMQGADTTKG